MLKSRSEACAGNGVQTSDRPHQRRASARRGRPTEVASRRNLSARAARSAVQRRGDHEQNDPERRQHHDAAGQSAATGSPSIRIVNPIRRSRAAASAAGSAVGKGDAGHGSRKRRLSGSPEDNLMDVDQRKL